MSVICKFYRRHPHLCTDDCFEIPVEADDHSADLDKQRSARCMANSLLAYEIASTWLMLISPRHPKYGAVVDLFIAAQANAIGWASR